MHLEEPKDLYQLFLEKEVRQAYANQTAEAKALLLLDYYQALLQACEQATVCELCSTKIDHAVLKASTANLTQLFSSYHQHPLKQTQQEWQHFFKRCHLELASLTQTCEICQKTLQESIRHQFTSIRRTKRTMKESEATKKERKL